MKTINYGGKKYYVYSETLNFFLVAESPDEEFATNTILKMDYRAYHATK